MREIIACVRHELGVSRSEAELIIATLLDRPRFGIYYNPSLSTAEKMVLRLRLKQLKHGVPLEYLTGKVTFRDRTLKIIPGVFIPRLETEYFVELIHGLVVRSPRRILEIGTGCGAIAIALGDLFPEAEIVATDVSPSALTNAAENIDRLGLRERIQLIQTSLFDGLTGRYDLIVSNPPYIPEERLSSLPSSVREFEPIRALNGGPGGLCVIKAILREGPSRLTEGGLIGLEIDEDSPVLLQEFLRDFNRQSSFHSDLFGRTRYLFVGEIKEGKHE